MSSCEVNNLKNTQMETPNEYLKRISPNDKYGIREHLQKERLRGVVENIMQKYAEYYHQQQLLIQRVTFCLPIEGDTFEKWFDKHFVMLENTMVEAKNQATIKYNQEEILELYSFLTDRWSAK